MDVTIYHNPRCSKSRQALGLIEARGVKPHVVEYLKTPPSEAELTRILQRLGMSARQLVRRKEAKEAGIDVDALSEAALVKAMVAHPAAIERPIVVKGDKVALGRPPENVLAIL
jgi:arsenate reductase (glutaredoxin)